MKIGELARITGTQVETIRYYEREKLLPEPARTDGNYRVYGKAHGERLAFIRHCRALDMSLSEVRVLLRFKDSPSQDCSGVNALIDEQVDLVAARLKELRPAAARIAGVLSPGVGSQNESPHIAAFSRVFRAPRSGSAPSVGVLEGIGIGRYSVNRRPGRVQGLGAADPQSHRQDWNQSCDDTLTGTASAVIQGGGSQTCSSGISRHFRRWRLPCICCSAGGWQRRRPESRAADIRFCPSRPSPED